MIQRIQTVWLLLAFICGVLIYFFPFWEAYLGYAATGMDEIGARYHPVLLLIDAVLVLVSFITIFLFKNRKRQLIFSMVCMLLFLIYFGWALNITQQENGVFQNFNIAEFKLGAYLPIIGIIFNMLARNGIRKDEKLIRSMDRLR